MKTLPPGTILQLMYLRERLENIAPGRFIEIGPGGGDISALLLELGWTGIAYDLEPRTVDHLKDRFSQEILDDRYHVYNKDFLTLSTSQEAKVSLIISSMVIEHLNDDLESKFMLQSRDLLTEDGLMIGLVPASPDHWGIEDDIAGHCRRYIRADLHSLAKNTDWSIDHLVGLTFPTSNILLPLSNFLVRKAEKSKIQLSELEKTKASGIRNVKFKTSFPSILSLFLNPYVLLPLHWLQKAFSSSPNSLVLYFEAHLAPTPLSID